MGKELPDGMNQLGGGCTIKAGRFGQSLPDFRLLQMKDKIIRS